jgi:peptidoglycan/LPS O-acetylase OafA/YrhL
VAKPRSEKLKQVMNIPPKQLYYPALDGLRGMAILLVIYQHYFAFFPYAGYGWIGVDIFFVLSGFLITRILLNTKNQPYYLSGFYIRRILRILPPYYLALILFPAIFYFIPALHDPYVYFRKYELIFWTYGQNWLYIFTSHPKANLFYSHFWSLAVEEQFYLLWPFVVLLCRSQRQLTYTIYFIIAIFIISRIGAWLYWGSTAQTHLFQFLSRGDGLCFGSLLAVWSLDPLSLKRKLLRLCLAAGIVCLFSILISVTVLNTLPYFSIIGYTMIAVLFTVLLYYILHYKSRLVSFLTWRPLRYLGKISYGVYLYHLPILILFTVWMKPITRFFPEGSLVPAILISLAALGATLLMSALSYVFFERPLLSLKIRTNPASFVSTMRSLFSPRTRP